MSNYKIESFVSPCCHDFNVFVDNTIICSNCMNVVKTLDKNEELTTSIMYNIENQSNISADLLNDQINKSGRCAHDPTFELCNVKCEKCGKLTRIMRDLNGAKYFVCSNCRHTQR